MQKIIIFTILALLVVTNCQSIKYNQYTGHYFYIKNTGSQQSVPKLIELSGELGKPGKFQKFKF
jgi:hypothetical protein